MAVDLYTLPHKGFRFWIADVATRLGAADLTDAAAGALLVRDADTLLQQLLAHGDHEDTFIHPLLARLSPDIERTLESQHHQLEPALDGLRRQVGSFHDALERSTVAGVRLALYRSLQRFAAANLLHLDFEETVVMPLLWSTTEPAELQAVMADFRQQVGAEVMAMYGRTRTAYTSAELAALGLSPVALAG